MGTNSDMIKPMKLGLVGKDLAHSFSKNYFSKKFENLDLSTYSYSNFEFPHESDLALFLLDAVFQLHGFNVTIPYKETIIPYLDSLHESAKNVQAVNMVSVINGELIGYNTDIYGFLQAFKPLLKTSHKKALLLGTGGASKSVAYALETVGIAATFVSRNPKKTTVLQYEALSKKLITTHQIIINCTPVGTYPNIDEYPNIPYQYINEKHLVLDLIYNPEQTEFLKKAQENGAIVNNGLLMLEFQAEKAWEIWNS